MSRDWQPFLDDIRVAARKVVAFTAGLDFEAAHADARTWDAVLHNLMIIGEAAKQLPPEATALYPSVDWRNVRRFRDILVHHYFAVDAKIVWDIVTRYVPDLLAAIDPGPGDSDGA